MILTAFPVGFFAGLFGIGGGLITVPFLFFIFESLNIDTNYLMHLAIGTSLTEKLGFFMEPFGEINDLNNLILNFDSGFTYLVKDNLQLDCSYGTRIVNKLKYFIF